MQTTTQTSELQEIFNQLPSAHLSSDDKNEVKLINFSLLQTIVSTMSSKAYNRGHEEGIDSFHAMIDSVFGSK